ncbi:MAG: hypothetical protein AB1752_12845 [Candidatus Zixiibacteriota bacterium]
MTQPEMWPTNYTILTRVGAHGGFNSVVLDAYTDTLSFVFTACHTGSLTQIGVSIQDSSLGINLNGDGADDDTMYFRIETVDSNGDHTGTLVEANALYNYVRTGAGSFNTTVKGERWFTLTDPVATTRGQQLALTVSLSVDANVTVIRSLTNAAVFQQMYPFPSYRTATTLTDDDELPVFGLRYGDTLYGVGNVMADSFLIAAVDVAGCVSGCFGATFDEIGVFFVSKRYFESNGGWFFARNDQTTQLNESCSLLVYKGATPTQVARAYISVNRNAALGGVHKVFWADSIFTGAPNDTFYVTLKPMRDQDVGSIDLLRSKFFTTLETAGYGPGSKVCYRNNSGAWSYDTTHIPLSIGLMFERVSAGLESEGNFGRRRKISQMGWLWKESTEGFAGECDAEVER